MLSVIFVLLFIGGSYFLTTVGYSLLSAVLLSVAVCFGLPFVWGILGSLLPLHLWRAVRNTGSVVSIILAFALLSTAK